MVAIASAANGDWSNPASWSPAQVPIAGDTITVTHSITIDGTVAFGDGSLAVINNGSPASSTCTSKVMSGGKLIFSRTVNSQLTIHGDLLVMCVGSAANQKGTIDMGTIASPIPLGVTARCRLNGNATVGENARGIRYLAGAVFTACGHTRKRVTVTTTTVAAAATTIYVADATGWQPGDKVWVGPTTRVAGNSGELVTIHASYTPGSLTVPLTAGLTYAHTTDVMVGNLSSNVDFVNVNDTYPGSIFIQWGNYAVASEMTMRNVLFFNVGHRVNSDVTRVGVSFSTYGANYNTPAAWNEIRGNAFWSSAANGGGFNSHANTIAMVHYDSAFVSYGGANSVFLGSGTYHRYEQCLLYSTSTTISTAYSEGSRGCVFTDCDITVSGNQNIVSSTGLAMQFVRCRFYGYGTFSGGQALPATTIDDSDVGYTFPLSNNATLDNSLINGSINMLSTFLFTNCRFGANLIRPAYLTNQADYDEVNAVSFIRYVNKDLDATNQWLWVNSGEVVRDNSTYTRSPSSIRIRPFAPNRVHSRVISVSTLNNVPVTVVGYLRFNTAWGTATPPSVTLSGLGITPQTYTAAATADTWHKFSFTATQTSGADGTLSLTFAGSTANANGSQTGSNDCQAWISGCVDTEFVTSTRHYGYLFDGLTSRKVDDSITEQVEATVAGYSVIDNLDKLHDRINLWACDNQLEAVFYDHAGAELSLGNFNLVVDATAVSAFDITGTTITIKASTLAAGTKFTKVLTTGTVTKSNGAIISALYADTSGPSAKLQITLPLAAMAVCVHDGADVEVECGVQTGVYTLLVDPGATGTWVWAINKQGYVFATGTFTPGTGGLFAFAPACPEVLTPTGTPMYQGTSSALVQVSFSGGFAYIDIGNGSPSLQNIFDACEDALYTDAGIDWIINGNDSTAIFNSFGGDYLFLTGGWRIRRWHVGDSLATVPAFVQSTEGIPVDETNGPVAYLTSDNPTAIAAAVRASLSVELARIDAAISTRATQISLNSVKTDTGLIPGLY